MDFRINRALTVIAGDLCVPVEAVTVEDGGCVLRRRQWPVVCVPSGYGLLARVLRKGGNGRHDGTREGEF